jgi:hypothetical protein
MKAAVARQKSRTEPPELCDAAVASWVQGQICMRRAKGQDTYFAMEQSRRGDGRGGPFLDSIRH